MRPVDLLCNCRSAAQSRRNNFPVRDKWLKLKRKRRFENLERKFKSDPKLHQTYTDFMREYLKLGHMSIATEPGVYFLPHHAVFKPSPVPKIRVVFDASAQVASGQSLNSRLYTGPKLQQDIVDILLRFRVHKFVFTADVC